MGSSSTRASPAAPSSGSSNLADDVKVTGANLENGLLTVDLLYARSPRR